MTGAILFALSSLGGPRFEGVPARAALQAEAALRSFALLAADIDGLEFVTTTYGHADE